MTYHGFAIATVFTMHSSAARMGISNFLAAILSLAVAECTSIDANRAAHSDSLDKTKISEDTNDAIVSAIVDSEAIGLHTAALQFSEKLDSAKLHKSPQQELIVSQTIITAAISARDLATASKWIDTALEGATGDRSILLKQCVTIGVYQRDISRTEKCGRQLPDGTSYIAALNRVPPTPLAALRSRFVLTQDYPPSSVVLQEEGTVTIGYVVDLAGNVAACRVTGSSGKASLDEAACSLAKKRWAFNPATRAGYPVEQSAQSLITFSLTPTMQISADGVPQRAIVAPQSLGSSKNFVSANSAFSRGDWLSAIDLYTQDLESSELTFRQIMFSYQRRGAANLRIHQYEKAIADANSLIQPEDSFYSQSIRGIAYIGLHRYDDGITELTRAISASRASIEFFDRARAACLLYDRGVGYQLKGADALASADFLDAERLEPATARYCLGVAKLLIGNTSGELDVIEARKANPRLKVAIQGIAGWLGGL